MRKQPKDDALQLKLQLKDFYGIKSPQELRTVLRPITKDSNNFDWLEPILATTLDEDASKYLKDFPPVESTYQPNKIQENLSEGSRLLDICVSQRTQIHALEAEAIRTALGILDSEWSRPDNFKIAKVQLRAAIVQAGGSSPGDDPLKSLESVNSIHASVVKYLLQLHRIPGSALNFGERVSQMRAVYYENLHSAIERLLTSFLGLVVLHGWKIEKPPIELAPSELLWKCVTWTRRVVDRLSAELQATKVVTFCFRLSNMINDIDKILQKSGQCKIEFDITNSGTFKGSRVLSIGLAYDRKGVAAELYGPAFPESADPVLNPLDVPQARFDKLYEVMQHSLYQALLYPPDQTERVEKGGRQRAMSWKPQPAYFPEGIPFCPPGTSPITAAAYFSGIEVSQISAVGKWTLLMEDEPVGKGAFRFHDKVNIGDQNWYKIPAINDLWFVLRLVCPLMPPTKGT